MSFNIAVAGKGGTGKTSIASLIIRHLTKNCPGPILAVDADPNVNLGESLGLKTGQTIGSIIASFNQVKINIPPGMTKEAYLEIKMHEAVAESKGIDLIEMGRGEGPDCYCYPNTLLRKFIDTMAQSYAYVVMDNEAGMEHLSRRTTQNVDALLLISDHSVKGARTIVRLKGLVAELKLTVAKEVAIINRVTDRLEPSVAAELEKAGITPIIIPFDQEVYEYDIKMKPLLDLPDTSTAVRTVADLMAKIL